MVSYSNLNRIARSYSEDQGFESVLMKYKIIEISSFVEGETMLDIGCGVGTLTKALAGNFKSVLGIDGSSLKIRKAKEKNHAKNIKYELSLFEDYKWNTKLDFIVCTNVLEHVDNALTFLIQIKKILSRNGLVVMTVPNVLGLHKRIGKAMGLIDDYHKLTQADLEKGHKRMYDMSILENDFIGAGFRVKHLGGILLKPLSHKQMETWDSKIVDALYEVGKELPEYCSSLLIAATH